MIIVLYQPQIPQNTGNIVRTCAVTGCKLVLVRPLGFSTSSRMLKRSGLDYWHDVDITEIDHLEDWLKNHFANGNKAYFFSSKAKNSYHKVNYNKEDALIFGSETSGLPSTLESNYSNYYVTLPMLPNSRCLNLANSAAIALYEAWRQHDFTQW